MTLDSLNNILVHNLDLHLSYEEEKYLLHAVASLIACYPHPDKCQDYFYKMIDSFLLYGCRVSNYNKLFVAKVVRTTLAREMRHGRVDMQCLSSRDSWKTWSNQFYQISLTEHENVDINIPTKIHSHSH